jgi:hypothetical protein
VGLSVSSCGFDLSNTLAASHTTEPRVINVDKKAFAPDGARKRPQSISPGYLDVTVNGEASASMENMLDRHARTIGNELLGIPVKR